MTAFTTDNPGSSCNNTAAPKQMSPTREIIFRMRRREEEQLEKCINVIKTMKTAIGRQKNVSMDVKNGLKELEEAVDTISDCRSKWKKAEMEAEARPDSTKLSGTNHQAAGGTTKSTEATKTHSSENEWTKDRAGKRKQVREEKKAATKDVHTRQQQKIAGGEKKDEAINKKKKTKTKNRQTKPRLDALLVKPAQGKSYAEVLRELRAKAKPEESGTEIKAVRKTRKGDMLLELGPNTKDKASFSSALKKILGERANITTLEPKETLEFRDLDSLTTTDEVQTAVNDMLGNTDDVRITLTNPNSRGLRMAIVQLNHRQAARLLETARIKIGWINSRIRRRVEVTRCFKCFGYGHRQSACPGPDRRSQGLCINCGEKGHQRKDCKNSARCFLCTGDTAPRNHVPGSGACSTFRKALDQARKRQ